MVSDCLLSGLNAVNFEARLEDGILVAKSDGVEFTVRDGKIL